MSAEDGARKEAYRLAGQCGVAMIVLKLTQALGRAPTMHDMMMALEGAFVWWAVDMTGGDPDLLEQVSDAAISARKDAIGGHVASMRMDKIATATAGRA